jgi:hypothetical protein
MIGKTFLCFAAAAAFLSATPSYAQEPKTEPKKEAQKKSEDTYDQDSVLKEAEAFFGRSTEGLAKVIEKAFKDQGRPNGYVKGEEAAGADRGLALRQRDLWS